MTHMLCTVTAMQWTTSPTGIDLEKHCAPHCGMQCNRWLSQQESIYRNMSVHVWSEISNEDEIELVETSWGCWWGCHCQSCRDVACKGCQQVNKVEIQNSRRCGLFAGHCCCQWHLATSLRTSRIRLSAVSEEQKLTAELDFCLWVRQDDATKTHATKSWVPRVLVLGIESMDHSSSKHQIVNFCCARTDSVTARKPSHGLKCTHSPPVVIDWEKSSWFGCNQKPCVFVTTSDAGSLVWNACVHTTSKQQPYFTNAHRCAQKQPPSSVVLPSRSRSPMFLKWCLMQACGVRKAGNCRILRVCEK